MKIAVFNTGRAFFGGAERRLGRTFNQIAKNGHEVHFVFRLFDNYDVVRKGFEDLLNEPSNIIFSAFSSDYKVFCFALRQKFDVVFYSGPSRSHLPFILGAKLSGSKTIFSVVNTSSANLLFSSIREKLNFRFVGFLSDGIDCLYPSSVDSLHSFFKGKTITTTPCPFTNLNLFKAKPKTKTIAFIGRWLPCKNIDLFVKAVLSIQDELHDCGYHVLLAGNQERFTMTHDIIELIKTCKYTDLINVLGYINPLDIIRSVEVFVSVQSINNYPSQSLLEAISSGCYIIASDEGDTSLLVRDSFGTLCSLSPESIASAILQYINKTAAEKQIAQTEARQFAEANFNFEHSVTYYTSLLKK